MFKFVLSALMSLLIASAPVHVSAKVAQKSSVTNTKKAKKVVVRKQRAARKKAYIVKRGGRHRLVLGNGRRAGYARAAVRSAPAYFAPSFGERAGLHLTPDPLSLRSNVAFVIDQNNAEVLLEKNADVALPIASITKLMTGLIVVQAGQDLNEILTITEDDVDRLKFTSSRLAVGSRMSRGD